MRKRLLCFLLLGALGQAALAADFFVGMSGTGFAEPIANQTQVGALVGFQVGVYRLLGPVGLRALNEGDFQVFPVPTQLAAHVLLTYGAGTRLNIGAGGGSVSTADTADTYEPFAEALVGGDVLISGTALSLFVELQARYLLTSQRFDFPVHLGLNLFF